VDARILGRLLQAGLIPEAYIPPKEVREARDLLRHRIDLGRDAARVKNRIHALIEKSWAGKGELDELSDALGTKGREVIRTLELPPNQRFVLRGLLRQLEDLEDEIEMADAALAAAGSEREAVRRLMQIGGINYYSAQVILSEIGDVNRFPSHRKLASYAGLVPSERSSGGVVRRGHITKEGSSRLRWILVNVVDHVKRYNPKLAAAYSRIKERRGAKVARVAVARHLLRIVYYMLRDGRDYEFRERSLESRKLRTMERRARRHRKLSMGESPCV
jgi:transposase